MNERIFSSFKEYKDAYFLDKIHETLVEANASVASQLNISFQFFAVFSLFPPMTKFHQKN